MAPEGSRARQFANSWLQPSLAALVGIGGAVGLAMLPALALGAQPSGPTVAETAPGAEGNPQPVAETPRPSAAAEDRPDWLIDLQDSLTAARQRIEELSKAAEAVAAAGQQKLAAAREENQQLRAELESARAERAELEKAKQASQAQAADLTKLRSRVQELEGSADQASAEAAHLREQIEASQQRSAAADRARSGAEARLQELRASLQRAEQDKARLAADLTKAQGELATAKKQAEAAGQAQAQIEQRAAAADDERQALRGRLTDVSSRLDKSESDKARLESELAKLKQAAGTAADDARQSLIALESRIKDLNQAASAIGPAAGPVPTAAARPPAAAKPARAAAAPPVTVAAAAPSPRAEPAKAEADEYAHFDQRSVLGGVPAILSLADLPSDRRQHVQGLLANLHSQMDERGLITTVPGEVLFAAGSDQVQAGAHDTLGKVADLIRMYGDRRVLIIGHTDADGDATDNQQLSERRAETVKQYFVDNFAFSPARLSTQGMGEARPIASNATSEGRRANRRVEVLILN
jgi:outer membrane protein OmpA-like peptidoglycan-associated protein